MARPGIGEVPKMRIPRTLLLATVVAALMSQGVLLAQAFRRGGTEFNAMREIVVPAKDLKPIMVTEFFHHGEITPDGKNVLVAARTQVVPSRVLQLGPGDFCRVAFQTISGQNNYELYYGGKPPEHGTTPPWTNRDGLLLETRKYQECNLNQLDAVRKAYDSAERIGADYVDNVRHSSNPFSLRPDPFMSHYSGVMNIGSAGTYGFITSSQDCSFLVIDGKEVASHPGIHGPMWDARPGTRKDIQLSAGTHEFDYYHAASGPAAIMVVAWEPSPKEPKPKPVAIPSDVFRTASVGRVLAEPVQLRELKMVPDFLVSIAGDVPLPDNDEPLVGVMFKDMSPKALTMGGRARWEFGDGQTSEENNPVHVYLRPGLYSVKLATGRKTAKPMEMVNRVYVDRPVQTKRDEKGFHKLSDYLPILDRYDPRTLDVASLRQLVLVYQWKADLALNPDPPDPSKPDTAKPENPDETKPVAAETPEQIEARREEAKKWIAKAVEAGKAPLVGDGAAAEDRDLDGLAQVIGPMARDRLGDSQTAFRVWQGAAAKIKDPAIRAGCLVEAADVLVNDLLDAPKAKLALEAAAKLLADTKTGPIASRLALRWGDYYAATGDGKAARKAYSEAEENLGSSKTHLERTALRGAHCRSTEEYIKNNDQERAAVEIHEWQKNFPTEKLDGYVTLMHARYWAQRKMYPQAVALSEQLIAASPDSPYADQILLLAAECEVSRGKTDRAVATLHSLMKDYPGSPLLKEGGEVKTLLKRLESGEVEQPKRKPRAAEKP
jgi:predicted negative regulator of RcsB-dependent stress response